MTNTMTEMKNTSEVIQSRLNETYDWISNLEDKVAENTQSEQQKEKSTQKNEYRLKGLWNNFKYNMIHIIGVPEGKEENKEIQTYFKN